MMMDHTYRNCKGWQPRPSEVGVRSADPPCIFHSVLRSLHGIGGRGTFRERPCCLEAVSLFVRSLSRAFHAIAWNFSEAKSDWVRSMP